MTERYVELRARSAFSFLRGASLPEALAARAAELGYAGLALSDVDGVYGAPRFHRAARRLGLRPLVGAELAVDGHPLLLLCQDQKGYQHLCRLLTERHLRGPLTFFDLEAHAGGLLALTGGEEGAVGAALDRGDGEGAAAALDRLVGLFGPERLAAELQVHFEEEEDRRNAAIGALARRHGLTLVLTGDVRYAMATGADLHDVLTCVRLHTTVDQAGTRLLRNGERYLKAPADLARLLPDLPEALDNTLAVADRCAFTLADLGYRFPDFPVPAGATQPSYLRALTFAPEATARFRPYDERVRTQLHRELALIERLGLAGYFLVMWDLVEFCRRKGILAQGRGSAANSAVCFALGITAVDPLRYDLLFERFLSEERGEWPDIDLDLPSGDDREAVIQYVYKKYGQRGCAMVATTICYRGKSAVRDVGKALGLPAEGLGRLSSHLEGFGHREDEDDPAALGAALQKAGFDPAERRVQQLLRFCAEIQDLPRHVSQHPGGMVLAGGRLDEVVPLQPATMPGRVVLQWDKDDCADMRLIKIDLLGLGMLAALSEARTLCPRHDGVAFDLAALPEDDPEVYAAVGAVDTVGMFQIESRAQMSALPKMQPRCFYDLVVQVALIRPGPIVGNLMHPYLRRRNGREAVTYPHPSLQPILSRTLGVPLFQEQVLKMAMVAAGLSGGEAEELRRTMTRKRPGKTLAQMTELLMDKMAARGITGPAAEAIGHGITSFAQYGFPESHAISFALIAYASAYLRVHHPALFTTCLLNAQPMGFYSPATLVKDAQHHGVEVLSIDVMVSDWRCTVEDTARPARRLRLGLRYVCGLRQAAGAAIVAERARAPFASLADLRHRCPALREDEWTTLAEIGALGSLAGRPSRRQALWQVSAFNTAGGDLLRRAEDPEDRSPLPEMTPREEVQADYRGSGLTVGPHPISFHREALFRRGALRAAELRALRAGARVQVGGVVIARQRPETAKGYLFLTLEDESGRCDVIVEPQRFQAERAVLCSAAALVVEGELQKEGQAVTLRGKRFVPLAEACVGPSRDFR